MVSKHLLVFTISLVIGIVISVKPSNVTIWSNQREIKDFILDKRTNDIYVTATFLYQLNHLEFVTKSMFVSHEYTATNVITFSESNSGLACSKVTALCFLFNSSNVKHIEPFDKDDFLPNSVSQMNIEIPDLNLLAVKIRGAESVSFLIADERISAQAYYLRFYPYTSFMNSLLTPQLSEIFSGVVDNPAIIRRALLTYTREGFIYYVVRHQEISGDYSLYIMRMCGEEDSGDTRVHSIVELRFTPCDSSKKYPQYAARGHLDNFFGGEVLLITFTSGESGVDSNLCVFTQYTIDIAFNTTIQSCFGGSAGIAFILPWLEIGGVHPTCNDGLPDSPCDLCNVMFPTACLLYNYTGIAGTEISGYNFSLYERITVLFPLSIDEVDLIFTGSEIGDLKKYELTSYNSIRLIEDFDLGNLLKAPFSRMLASSDSQYLYASRTSLLYKIDILNCQMYTSCEECVTTEDPICGYCSLTETCTRRSACANPDLSLRWITNNSNHCLSLNSITPDATQTGENTEIAISINSLPQLLSPHLYQCEFDQTRTDVSRIVTSGLNVNLTGPDTPGHSILYCDVPTEFTIPNDYKEINFSMLSTELNRNFASQTNGFAFYNCTIHPRCENCTNSPAPCFWCLYNSICTHSDSLCDMDSIPPGSISTSCPAITGTSGLLVHIGNSTQIDMLELVMVNAPEDRGDFNYSCEYTFNSTTVVTREGVWQSSTQVDCIPPPRLYTASGNETAELQLKWGKHGIYYYITEEPIGNVTIFNCEVFEQTCSICFGNGSRFGCGNCYKTADKTGDPTCRLEIQCNSSQTFLNNSLPCPDPTILNFEPKGGHRDGGTHLIITGENLGGSEVDLTVLVANISCMIPKFVMIGKIINCTTGMSTEENSGPISVSVKGEMAESADTYSYLLPTVTSVNTLFPNGSLSATLAGVSEGGTLLQFNGTNLGIVSEISIKDEINCFIQNGSTPMPLDSSAINCTTEKYGQPVTGVITLSTTEKHNLNYQTSLFNYENLQIIGVSAEAIIPAGGIRVKIRPNNYELLHDTKLIIVNNSIIVSEQECTEISPKNEIVCVSPAYTYSEGLEARLVVDNLTLQVQQIEIKERNPVCENNPNYTDSIIIKGTDFLFVAEEHYDIYINSSSEKVKCNIIIFSDEILECRPEKETSGALFVEIGENLICTFSSPISPEYNVNQYIISAASTLLLMIILSVFLITCFAIAISYYKYKKVREIKGLMHLYSKMESNIAKECKTGFAELQVEIVDFVQAAETNTIPFTDYQTYVVKLLFSRNQFVDFLSLPPNDPLKANEDIETFRRAMKLFQELFNNKEFLIEMIRVFDQNHNFDANERTYFASLLMVALHKNLFYATEILKVLIDDLIAKSLNRPNQEMKTLFRSTSVCEKLLSHWLALCMYNYLKGRPGEELYSLYSAIKVQINKGPIDAITGEAKYSLNQDNMLRMTFEVNEFEILCHFGENFDTTKLLDCDTITQVKRKIIDTLNKNMLASEKPDPDQLELIFVKPKDFSPSPKRKQDDLFSQEVFTNPIYTPGDETMHREIPTLSKVKQPYLLFRDIDKTSGIDVGWRRINTMQHYFTFFNIVSPEDGSLLLTLQSDLKEKFPSLYLDTIKRKSTETSPKIFHFSIPGSVEATLDRQRVVSEVYFTKLLSTKAILQKYIDEMMSSIFPDRITSHECPIAIKHLFNFLEERAKFYNITDPEVIHTWKNNSVVLRFWVNLLKNPQFILDIDMPAPVDSTLSTIAQGLIDSCSTRDEELTKDSPANKLLFAKDTKLSRKRVKKFYEDLQNFHQTQSSFNQHLRQMQLTNSPFFVESAVQEIFLVWISGTSFVGNLLTRLREQKLDSQIAKFTQVLNMMSDNPSYDDPTII